MAELVTVSKEVFFASVGPLNVHPRPERERTVWETPERRLIGISTPGYMATGEASYAILAAFVKEAKK